MPSTPVGGVTGAVRASGIGRIRLKAGDSSGCARFRPRTPSRRWNAGPGALSDDAQPDVHSAAFNADALSEYENAD